ncbi:MAG: chromate resistance protein ChrB domain-containing protein [Hyphomicrobiaceae bacterium]
MGKFTITPTELYQRLGSPDAPIVLDVCKCEDYDIMPRLIPSSRWRDHQKAAEWAHEIPRGQRVVTVCVRGKKVSQAAAAELRLKGIDAAALVGGNEAWEAAGLPTVAKRLGIGNRDAQASRWVTRVLPKIDRIACPWLIARFIDPAAKFFYVEPAEVINSAKELNAIPYDVDGVELTHRGERDSFDAILEDFGIKDPALDRVAAIVRGADTARLDLAPEAAGLLAISLGISHLSGPDDHVALERGFGVYDALYAWARFAAGETHNWPAKKATV